MIRTKLDGTSHVPMTRTQNSNQFYLQSCLSVDYIIWEEPTIVPANVNEWKLLLEGAPVQVSVKNSQDEMLQRTPFFITTNNALGYWLSTLDTTALEQRCLTFELDTPVLSPTEEDEGDGSVLHRVHRQPSRQSSTLDSRDILRYFHSRITHGDSGTEMLTANSAFLQRTLRRYLN
jgi:hypothetical protein